MFAFFFLPFKLLKDKLAEQTKNSPSRFYFHYALLSPFSMMPKLNVYMYQIISDENEITCFIIIRQIMLILIAAFISFLGYKLVKLIEKREHKRGVESKLPSFSIFTPLLAFE